MKGRPPPLIFGLDSSLSGRVPRERLGLGPLSTTTPATTTSMSQNTTFPLTGFHKPYISTTHPWYYDPNPQLWILLSATCCHLSDSLPHFGCSAASSKFSTGGKFSPDCERHYPLISTQLREHREICDRNGIIHQAPCSEVLGSVTCWLYRSVLLHLDI
jgi:hypothetical protein